MVARHVRDVDAAGSTPVISTTAEKVPFRVPFLLCIENEESNLTEVLALRKQFGELFLAKSGWRVPKSARIWVAKRIVCKAKP